MRILVLCRDFPLPLTSGEKIRCFHILQELAKHHEVSLISLVHRESELQYVEELKRFCQFVYPIRFKFSKKLSAIRILFSVWPWEAIAFYKEEMKLKIRDLVSSQKYDIVWVNFLSMANYIDPKIALKSVFVLDQHNADELVWQNYSRSSNNVFMKIFAALNLQKLKIFQREMLNYFGALVCVSEKDASFMKDHVPAHVQTWVVPNGVDPDYFRPIDSDHQRNNIIMLCASMDVFMNVDAAYRFAKEVFPTIKDKIPDCVFWIVGRDPTKVIRGLAKEGYIEVTGSVEDVRPYYQKARVIIAPYRLGGGTKLKILEAMAMNLPIVSTSVGCQGIDIAGKAQIIIRDNMKEFAEAVVNLLRAEAKDGNRCVEDARRLVEERYGWSSIVEKVEPHLANLVRQRKLLETQKNSH